MPVKSFIITPERYAALRLDLADAGVTLPAGNTGSFNPPKHPEITLGYAYLNGTLQLTILHDAWYESADAVWNGLQPYLA